MQQQTSSQRLLMDGRLNPTPLNDPILADIKADNNLLSGRFSHFISLGHLAKKFDEQEITIRRVFKKLVHKGLLREGRDFIKEDYVNERNFIYKINPEKFVELITQLDISPDNSGDAALLSLKDKYLNKRQEARGEAIESTQKVDDKVISSDIKGDNTVISHPDILDSFVDYLKSQIKEKDDYIKKRDDYLIEKDRDYKTLSERLNRREHDIKNLISQTGQLEAKVYVLEERNKQYQPEPEEFVQKKKGLLKRLFGK